MPQPRVRGGVLAALVVAILAPAPAAQEAPPFDIVEASTRGLREALASRRTTCRAIVEAHLRRIEVYDKHGPAINAIVTVNPAATTIADDLDRRFAQAGAVGPMHCVPIIVKDNYETVDMPTTAGSLSLKGMMTGKDAFVVRRLRDAGAVILAKANMHEFAFSQYETVSSILPGYTRNPYDLSRVTAGSSGGTAAAVAASFGVVGLGTDTGASIRGPASFQALVGLRPTLGLTSRSGVVPVFLDSDVTGPMARTVADLAELLTVIAGEDPADPATAASRPPAGDYAGALVPDGLRAARLGNLLPFFATSTADPGVTALFGRALDDLRKAGATVVDVAGIDRLDRMRRQQRELPRCNQFQFEINRYLEGLGGKAPVGSLDEIVKSRLFHPSIQPRLESSLAANDSPGTTPGCRDRAAFRDSLRAEVSALLQAQQLDAFVYPTWSNPPRLTGDLNSPHGDNNQFLAPNTGFPGITVPMGYTNDDTLPAGLQFVGAAWSESVLIRLAYAYEQATHHRRPPSVTQAAPQTQRAPQ